jgi:hypothetical protein
MGLPSITSNDLSQAITSEQWDRVLVLCQSKPDSAKVWSVRQGLFEGIKDSNVLPIHEALVGGAPFAIVAAILTAYPDCVFAKESSYKRLPLHCACRKNALMQVAELLLKSHSEAALIADDLGRLPSKYCTRRLHGYIRMGRVDKLPSIASHLSSSPVGPYNFKTCSQCCLTLCIFLFCSLQYTTLSPMVPTIRSLVLC